jgi:hypothetical protein
VLKIIHIKLTVYLGVAQIGSFELDRCLRQIKGKRKGAAVEIFSRPKA